MNSSLFHKPPPPPMRCGGVMGCLDCLGRFKSFKALDGPCVERYGGHLGKNINVS